MDRNPEDNCYICLNLSGELHAINVNNDKITLLSMLQACVPYINWLSNGTDARICGLCKAKLDHVYEFYVLCTATAGNVLKRRQIKIEEIDIKIEDGSTDDDTNSKSMVVDIRQHPDGDGGNNTLISCNICLASSTASANSRIIKKFAGNTASKFTIIAKLASCLPTASLLLQEDTSNYATDCHLCNLCEENLNETYNFHELCRKREKLRKKIKSVIKKTATTVIKSKTIKQQKRVNVCKYCGDQFTGHLNYMAHLRAHHPTKMTCECDMCGLRFTNQSCVARHKRLHATSSTLICAYCGKSLDSTESMRAHLTLSHAHRDTYKCSYCGVSFSASHSLYTHVMNALNHANTHEYKCRHCDKTLSCAGSLRSHELIHMNKRNYKCGQCGTAAFNTLYALQMHELYKHTARNEWKFKCDYCGVLAPRQSELRIHMRRRHQQGAPMPSDTSELNRKRRFCNVCGKFLGSSSKLRVHLAGHLNKREYKCDKCDKGKGFNTAKGLRDHQMIAHVPRSEWKFPCGQCASVFPQQCALRLHMKRHTNDRQYLCHICEKAFVLPLDLKMHMRSHSNVCDFQCEHCRKEFKYKSSLRKHWAKVHGIGGVKRASKKIIKLEGQEEDVL